jgi:hypothetical protein
MTTSPASVPTHPSYLQLDRFSLGFVSDDVAHHLESCAACRSHVQSLSRTPHSGLTDVTARLERQRRSRRRVWWTASSALAAAACLLLMLGRFGLAPAEDKPSYVGTKGLVSVWIYVKRGQTTQLWDGKQAVVAGDRLRIKVDPAGYDRVAVYSVQDPDAPSLLYAGAVVPGRNTALPAAWEIDAEGPAEHLIVVFSQGVVEPSWTRWLNGQVEPGVSVLPFVLPKSSAPPPDASGSP